MCFAHSNAIWCQKSEHLALLKGCMVKQPDGSEVFDKKKNLAAMKEDLTLLNLSIHTPELVKIAEKLMYKRWREDLKEEAWTDAYESSWLCKNWTRCESNQFGDGGLPSDNNALEATNGSIKTGLDRRLPLLTELIATSREWLSENAMKDNTFGDKYNTDYVAFNFWEEVHASLTREFPVNCITFDGYRSPAEKTVAYSPSMACIQEALDAGCARVSLLSSLLHQF